MKKCFFISMLCMGIVAQLLAARAPVHARKAKAFAFADNKNRKPVHCDKKRVLEFSNFPIEESVTKYSDPPSVFPAPLNYQWSIPNTLALFLPPPLLEVFDNAFGLPGVIVHGDGIFSLNNAPLPQNIDVPPLPFPLDLSSIGPVLAMNRTFGVKPCEKIRCDLCASFDFNFDPQEAIDLYGIENLAYGDPEKDPRVLQTGVILGCIDYIKDLQGVVTEAGNIGGCLFFTKTSVWFNYDVARFTGAGPSFAFGQMKKVADLDTSKKHLYSTVYDRKKRKCFVYIDNKLVFTLRNLGLPLQLQDNDITYIGNGTPRLMDPSQVTLTIQGGNRNTYKGLITNGIIGPGLEPNPIFSPFLVEPTTYVVPNTTVQQWFATTNIYSCKVSIEKSK